MEVIGLASSIIGIVQLVLSMTKSSKNFHKDKTQQARLLVSVAAFIKLVELLLSSSASLDDETRDPTKLEALQKAIGTLVKDLTVTSETFAGHEATDEEEALYALAKECKRIGQWLSGLLRDLPRAGIRSLFNMKSMKISRRDRQRLAHDIESCRQTLKQHNNFLGLQKKLHGWPKIREWLEQVCTAAVI